MANYLVTGVAGFIASRVTEMLIADGHIVVGIDYMPDVFRNIANVDKARRILSWQPQTSLDQGVTNLVDWYLQERDWVKDIATP